MRQSTAEASSAHLGQLSAGRRLRPVGQLEALYLMAFSKSFSTAKLLLGVLLLVEVLVLALMQHIIGFLLGQSRCKASVQGGGS